MSQNEPVSVRILDREYTVGVEPAERDSLTAAARMLDTRMREIRGSNRMAAVDRVAVLAEGRLLAVGTPAELADHPALLAVLAEHQEADDEV